MKKIIAIIFAVSLFTACGNEQEFIPEVAVPAAQTQHEIVLSGVVQSDETRNIYSTLGFTIARVYAELGDYVREGQLLAILDTADLELTIAQQKSTIEQARQNSQNTIESAQRMLSEAQANLANNTNIHIVSASASLSAAQAAVQAAQIDLAQNTGLQVTSAESQLRTASLELERLSREHGNIQALQIAGVATAEELRQVGTALTHARNQYNDARTSYNNAREQEERQIEQLQSALQRAVNARNSAQEMLRASRVAAEQEIERLRSQVANAEIAGNLEHMEASLRQLERQLDDAQITAPISGTVTAVIAREGAAGMGLMFTVEDTDNLKIVTSLREYDLAKFSSGTQVNITTSGTGSTVYTGVISRISPAANPDSPVVEFETEVEITSADTALRIGMSARVTPSA